MSWFENGDDYAAHRPTYPTGLVDALLAVVPTTDLAVDVGCGTGQLTAMLSSAFDTVIGLDPSEDQIRHAQPAANIDYRVGTAERLDVEDSAASLITVAQAAHWFDLPAFYREVRRIAAADAIIALITYGVVVLDDDLTARFSRFYRDEIGPYWPPERCHVDNAYADLDFPFPRIEAPSVVIERSWTLADFVGYLNTWSAVRRAREAGVTDLVDRLATDLQPQWGAQRRPVRWPVTILLGQIL
ncbi:MAG: class I SAM-dependent methyltransferase [Gordonia sp. (in: high G+C Gram-positive bacteria)]